MMKGAFFSPTTQRQFKRFRKIKRAWWSFIALSLLYFLGLCANLIANKSPLFIWFESKAYFPILSFHSEDEFLENGIFTEANYKDLREADCFKEEGNFMLFPFVEFGPYEALLPEDIDIDEKILLNIEAVQHVASVDIYSDLRIRKAVSPEFFFDGKNRKELRKLFLDDFWELDRALIQAIESRFKQESSAEFVGLISSKSSKLQAEVSLPAYKSTARAVTKIRLTFRELLEKSEAPGIFISENSVFSNEGIWASLSDDDWATVTRLALSRNQGLVDDYLLDIDAKKYRISFHKEDIHFPFRPTKQHFMGLDSSGRDVFTRLLYALRISLNFGFLLVISTTVVGIIVGALQGYLGGKIDLFTQRLIEIWESMPFLYILIFAGSVFGQSFFLLLVLYAIFNWIGISYYIRGEFLKLRKQPFVEAALCLGLPRWKIMFKHILPNAMIPVITFFPFSLVGAIGILSALDYLGFGMPPPTPSWGELMAQAQEFPHAWWLIFYPAFILFIVVLFGVFIGEGVRAAFDPRSHNRID